MDMAQCVRTPICADADCPYHSFSHAGRPPNTEQRPRDDAARQTVHFVPSQCHSVLDWHIGVMEYRTVYAAVSAVLVSVCVCGVSVFKCMNTKCMNTKSV